MQKFLLLLLALLAFSQAESGHEFSISRGKHGAQVQQEVMASDNASAGSEVIGTLISSQQPLHFFARIMLELPTNKTLINNSTGPRRIRRVTPQVIALAAAGGCLLGGGIFVAENGWSVSNAISGCAAGGSIGVAAVTLGPHLWGRKKRSTQLQAEECQLIVMTFSESDHNNDGVLSFDEIDFHPNVSQANAHQFFDVHDTNHNGHLEPSEVSTCLQNVTIPTNKRRKRCSGGGCTQSYYYPVYY